ncbi:autotransporter domain-containing protein [Pectobacterium punjabense]|uniref:autotransporter domain-containing protein n=1 Tax=Pectobacterium punjabense TaxID=2108399 RepID=UPI0019697B45|nr:autotransporter domain-containing protein [Pectobacterium punjabense]MBN3134818.1 autotransporter domain-containing protein [Pectobacterium punjabense]MCE5382246.1 autotransporter domain-containing protein [Pectobacterium punjabense]
MASPTKALLATAIASLIPFSIAAAEGEPASAIDVLSGFNKFWTAGTAWNNGIPTTLGEIVLRQNIQTVIDIARSRTQAQEISAFEFDAQDANYAVIAGLGPLASILKTETGAFTTVDGIPDRAYSSRVSDGGNGLGSATSGLGKVIELVNAVRYPASTTPAKNNYNYPRPFRQTLDGEDLSWVLQRSLVARVPATGNGDGGFPSGHTNAGYLSAFGLAYAVPQQYSDLILRAGEIGYSRVVTGIHSPLDVIGGRMHATYYAIQDLIANPTLRAEAYDQAQAFFAGQCGGTITACYTSGRSAEAAYAQYQIDKALYAKYTFENAFTPIGDTRAAAIVPQNAEVLIETRYPYLTAAQQRDILATTSNASGGVMDNGMGYDRLNLFKAANGYGAFNSNVAVVMNATNGGLSAADLWLNDITGTGSLTKSGSGQLTLAGRNSWSGGTSVSDGTLIGTNGRAFGTGAIVNDATLAFDINTDDTLANDISGNGILRKDGVAKLTYTGNGSSFTGTTQVTNGRLAINGSLGGSIVVADGATVSGSGTLGSLTVASGSTLAPGNSIGTLRVNGDLTLTNGAIYEVEVDPETTESDLIAVTGTATLGDASVLHVGQNGDYRIASTYTILTADKGISGTFGAVTSRYAFLDANLGYTANAVTMQLARNDITFASVATTANQSAAANAVESLGTGNAVYNAVAMLDRGAPQNAFDALSGEGYASLAGAMTRGALTVSDTVTEHARTTHDDNVWLNVYGGRHDANGANGTADTDYRSNGFLLGIDGALSDNMTLGIFAGADKGDVDVNGRHFSADVDNYQLGAYANYTYNRLGLTFGTVGSWGDIAAQRDVTVGSLNEKLSADLDARTLQVFGEARMKFDANVVTVEPFARLAHVASKMDSFSEAGGAAALGGEALKMDTTFSTLGVRLERSFGTQARAWTVNGSVGWRHAFGDIDPTARLHFIGADNYNVTGTPLAENSVRVEAGIGKKLTDNANLSLSYGGQFGGGVTDNAAHLKLNVRF